MTGDWQSLSRPDLITQLATVCRQLAALRDRCRQTELKFDLLAKIQQQSPPEARN